MNRAWTEFLGERYVENLWRLADRVYDRPEVVLPPKDLVFNAFEHTTPESVRVVILGQDPYPTEGKPFGMSFAYHPDYAGPITSSLLNIMNEVHRTEGAAPMDPSLRHWAAQGVLMMNTRLTVAAGKPMSHSGLGWEAVTHEILERVSHRGAPLVWLLWGREARHYLDHTKEGDLVLVSSHPCKHSAHLSFRGNNHFKLANEFLVEQGGTPIDWIGRAR